MRYLVSCICMFLLFSCKPQQDDSQGEYNFNDSIPSETDQNSVSYAIPSPNQNSLLLREQYPFYEKSLFDKNIDINANSTSEKKALILGALCADFGYLSIYDQKDLAIQYLNNIREIMTDSDFAHDDPEALIKRIYKNLDKKDTILNIVTEIIKKEDEIIRNGERPYLRTLIVAGGWIESFYLLNSLYNSSKNSNLFGMLLQQKYVLENLIQSLGPYYKKSNDYTNLVDSLVEIAYEYEVVDVTYKNIPAENTDSLTFIKCRFTPIISGSQLDKMFNLSLSLRNNSIY